MRSKLWLIQLPLIAIFTFCFWIAEQGGRGNLENAFLRETYRALSRVSNLATDLKFKLRGPQEPKNKIVIVEVDEAAIRDHGRWPWHRDVTAALIDNIFRAGAKVVGLDMVFSEPDRRVPSELEKELEARNAKELAQKFETDPVLGAVIQQYSERLVLGWSSDNTCQPLYSTLEECPVSHPDAIASHPDGFSKFSYSMREIGKGFEHQKSPLYSGVTVISNLPEYNALASHAGFFNVELDTDGVIRKAPLFMILNSIPYPSLALETVRVALGEDLYLKLNPTGRVDDLGFVKSGRSIPVNQVGVLQTNFRGAGRTFTYVSANDMLTGDETLVDEMNRKLASARKSDVLKDAIVFVGVSALGVFDMRSFPFGINVPGVEGHAFIADNLLSGDALSSGAGRRVGLFVFLFMVFGALGFAYASQKLESIPALTLFLMVFAGFTFTDLKILFANNINSNTAFVYLEFVSLFFFTSVVKYVMEEQNKKFVRGAFSKYVAPAVVDAILKDPKKLSLGGEKRDLTIMFSDIRSFTTFSEKMDAKALAAFLNEYLTMMTNIVIQNQGTLDKYIGDAIMAFWGAPLDQPVHAANACKAAREMMKALAENKARFKETYGIDVNIGVGVNSGVVSVGNMGSNSNFAYTVIGDHVNLASRLEGLTKYYGTGALTTRFTLDGIAQSGAPIPPHRVVDSVKVKGRETAVELIELLASELPAEAVRIFEQARALYRERKWDEAISRFREASRLFEEGRGGAEDGPSRMYIERCEELKANPPAADWDGSWKMESK